MSPGDDDTAAPAGACEASVDSPVDSPSFARHLQRLIGGLLLLAGLAGLGLSLLRGAGAPVPRPPGGALWTMFCLAVAFGGAAFAWRADHPRTTWTPSRPGRRFRTAVLYTRRNCPLCDEAHELLAAYSPYLPELIVVDIDEDPSLREKFNTCVPVAEFDGKPRFRGRISEPLLQRLLEGTPPERLR